MIVATPRDGIVLEIVASAAQRRCGLNTVLCVGGGRGEGWDILADVVVDTEETYVAVGRFTNILTGLDVHQMTSRRRPDTLRVTS